MLSGGRLSAEIMRMMIMKLTTKELADVHQLVIMLGNLYFERNKSLLIMCLI